jgi:hypothetical protein
MGHLLTEVANSELFVATEMGFSGSLADIGLICNHTEGRRYALSFLTREEAAAYLRDYDEPIDFVRCKGLELLTTLTRRDTGLGLYIIDAEQGYCLGPDLVSMGVGLTNFRDAEVVSVQYAPSVYTGTISRDLRSELSLFCSQHPHIEKIYLCEVKGVRDRPETLMAIVGDSDASDFNVQDVLVVIGAKTGLIDWYGNITWVRADESEEFFLQHGIDCVYERGR